jgi:hypothetical protein
VAQGRWLQLLFALVYLNRTLCHLYHELAHGLQYLHVDSF